MIIELDDIDINITHRTNKRIKRVSLIFENKSNLIIRTPLTIKTNKIKQIILSNKQWILNTFKKIPKQKKLIFDNGKFLPLLGVLYPIVIVNNNNAKKISFIFKSDTFYIEINDMKEYNYDMYLDSFKLYYKNNAKTIIDPIFDTWCDKTKLYPQNINYRKAKKRWGSCSSTNNISINYMLLQFDRKTIDYIVLHELCHIKEKNHSKRFWDLVSLHMPNYKEQEKNLKNKIF